MLELRPGLIQEAVNELQLRGGAATQAHPEGRPLAAKTVHSTTASLLFTCLADATRLEHIPANHMACRKVNLPRRPKPNPAALDATALCTVFKTAAGTRLFPLVVTAASSGCRRGELLALTWADLDIEKGLMRVSKSVEQTDLDCGSRARNPADRVASGWTTSRSMFWPITGRDNARTGPATEPAIGTET